MTVKETKSKVITVRFTPSLFESLHKKADSLYLSDNAFINMACSEYIKAKELNS